MLDYTGLPRPALSSREIEVLRAWLLHETKAEVAALLHISPGTVNTHLTRLRRKLAEAGLPAPTKAALVARALQLDILTLAELCEPPVARPRRTNGRVCTSRRIAAGRKLFDGGPKTIVRNDF